MKVRWHLEDFGYSTTVKRKDIDVRINLHVGNGISTLPLRLSDGVLGFADIAIDGVDGIIPERMFFYQHDDNNLKLVVMGEFNDLSGNVSDCWDIDVIKCFNPNRMDDGDERNDDIMKNFILTYVRRLVYEDEVNAAGEEGFLE